MNVVTTSHTDAATIGKHRFDPIESDAASAALAGRGAFDLRYIVAAIRANLLLIFAIIAAVFAIAMIATMLQTPRYSARTTVQINDASGSVLGRDSEMETDSNNSDWDIDRFLKTQTDIIASRGLAQRVAQRLKLVGNEKFFASQETDLPPPDTSPELLRRQSLIRN